MLLNEILQKEEEKHRLTYIGIVVDWEKTVCATEKVLGLNEIDLECFKQKLLEAFYNVVLRYSEFIDDTKAKNVRLRNHHFNKTALMIARLRKDGEVLLDAELKTGSKMTLACHFSETFYDAFYERFLSSECSFIAPKETDMFFFEQAREKYPMKIDDFIRSLSSGCASLWEVCASYMQSLSATVVHCFLRKADRTGVSDLVRDEVWTGAYEVLRKKLVDGEGNIPVFGNGSDFRNYIIKVCRFIAGNAYKKYALDEDYIEDTFPNLNEKDGEGEDEDYSDASNMPELEDADGEADDNPSELDIDPGNPYEVAHAVSIVLLNSQHPLHRELTSGIEDKVRILIDKTAGGMSYREIIEDMYGENDMSEEDFNRAVVKARKDYERVRKALCERMINFVEKKNGRTVTSDPNRI